MNAREFQTLYFLVGVASEARIDKIEKNIEFIYIYSYFQMVSNAIYVRDSCYIAPVLIRFISTYEIKIYNFQSCVVDRGP